MNYSEVIEIWNEFIQEFPDAIDLEEFDILSEKSYIREEDKVWVLSSDTGDKLTGTLEQIRKRLKQIELFRHMKSDTDQEEFARQECYCTQCHREFFVRTMCHLERCPYCGDDDLEEITGEL